MNNRQPYILPLLTDFYEVTMAYAYFTAGKQDEPAVFDLHFRRNPFGGEFTVCAGIGEALALIENYRWTADDIDFVAERIALRNEAFKHWLAGLDCSRVRVYAIREGDIMFPRVPVLRIEGPLGICQLLESTLLNLIGYASLVATNAARLHIAAGAGKSIIEFGLRRAQGPDGAMSAARYSYLGGADGTSNVLAGQVFDIPTVGTQAHAYISAFTGLENIPRQTLIDIDGTERDFLTAVLRFRKDLGFDATHDGELAAFIAYALSFPGNFLALVDTYDTIRSGLPNALCVSLALWEFGYRPTGIRLDSGDLSHLSRHARHLFQSAAQKSGVDLPPIAIVASNELDESTIRSLKEQGHEIDIFGVGTHLVTCAGDPSLGVVYKLVEINGRPRIKISEEPAKVTIPGRKTAYRLYGAEGYPLVDVMLGDSEAPPEPGQRILCCHPYQRARRTWVTPSQVEPLHHLLWDGRAVNPLPTLSEARELCRSQIGRLREDHLRQRNPTPYKVSLSEPLFDFMHELWEREAAVGDLR